MEIKMAEWGFDGNILGINPTEAFTGNRCEDIDSAIAKLQARKVAEVDG